MTISRDAIIFGMGYLRGPKSKLSFGGAGAEMQITDRARSALNELLAAGLAEPCEPYDQWPGREHYQGRGDGVVVAAKEMGYNPFTIPPEDEWPCFVRVNSEEKF